MTHNQNRLLLTSVLVLAFCLAFSAKATAQGLHLCNKTSHTIWAAIVIESFSPLSPHDKGQATPTPFGDAVGYVRSFGWFEISPGACNTPISDSLSSANEYYFWAHNAEGSTWDGTQNYLAYCINPGHAFDYSTTNATNCNQDNKRLFNPLNIDFQSDWTQNLTP